MPLTISYPNIQHLTIPPSITLVTVLYFLSFFPPSYSLSPLRIFLCYFSCKRFFAFVKSRHVVGAATYNLTVS